MAKSVNSLPLPLELEVDILSRLSHKKLYDIRLVCKHWHALISTQEFLLAYQWCHSLKDPFQGSSIIIDDSPSPLVVKFVGEDDTICSRQRTQSHTQRLVTPVLIGSCNGLVCFECQFPEANRYSDRTREQLDVLGEGTQTRRPRYSHKTKPRRYLISNPATDAYKVVPILVTKDYYKYKKHFTFLSGIGYDLVGDDYKVLRIEQLRDEKAPIERRYKRTCYMYSLKANSWEEISTPYVSPCSLNRSALWSNLVPSHSALHWFPHNEICHHTRCNSIHGFHLGAKEFFEIPLPDGLAKGVNYLATLKGCLHITRTVFNRPSELCIWIMKDYGIKESWTKVFSLSGNSDKFSVQDFGTRSILSILAYSGDGNEIIVGSIMGECIFRFNLQTREAKVVDLSPISVGVVMPWTSSSYPLFINSANIFK